MNAAGIPKLTFSNLIPGIALIVSLAFALLPLPVQAQDDSSHPEAAVSAEIIELKIAEVEASTTLDEQTAGTLVDLYRKSLTNLERVRLELESADEYSAAGASAPDDLTAVRQLLQNPEEPETFEISQSTPLPELEQALTDEKTRLVAAEGQLSGIQERLATETARPGPARERLNEARKERDGIGEQLDSPDPIGELAEITEARRWNLQTRAELVSAEIRKLDQEILSNPNRVALLEARQALADLETERSRARAGRLEDAITQRRGDEAEVARREAEAAREEVKGRHPAVRELAAANVELSERLAQRVIDVQSASDQRDWAKQETQRLGEELRSIKSKLAIAGLSQALGQLLVEQQRGLPDIRDLEKLSEKRDRQVRDVALEQILLDEERQDLLRDDDFIERLSVDVSVEEASTLQPELEALRDSRLDLIEKSIEADVNFLRVLGELDLADRQLIDTVRGYDEFLERRLLWVRNTTPFSIGALSSIPADLGRFFSASAWKQLLQDLANSLRDTSLAAILLGGLLVLGFGRRRFLVRVDASAKHQGQIGKERFSHALEAFFFTALAAAPFPLILIITGKVISGSALSAEFSNVIASSLVAVGTDLLVIQFFIDTCRQNGLAITHCGWNGFTVRKLSEELRWFRILYPVLRFVGETSYALDSGPVVGGLSMLCMTGSALSLAVLIFRLFIPDGGIAREFMKKHPGGLLARFRPVWFSALTAIVPLLILLWLAGYNYAGSMLAGIFMYSLWLLLWLALLQSLMERWLLLSYRRLEFEAAKESRETADSAKPEETGSGSENIADGKEIEVIEPEIDYTQLNSESRKLLNTLMGFVAAISLWMIWSPVLPALGILEDVSLWTHMALVDGESVQVPVTLMDLLIAFLVGLATWAAARGLPSLLELALLQRKDITAGTRYTATTLLRYTIVGIGVIWIFGILGASWAQVQWLVAALGVGIGFGLQEIVANFISGLIILFERPVRVGDVVSVGDTSGVVTRIQIRATTIRDWQRRELLVPNREFVTNRLLNWSLSDTIVRLDILIGIDYRSDVIQAMKLAEETAREHSNVLDDPPPFVIFKDFGDNALNLKLMVYIPSMDNSLSTRSELHTRLKSKYEQAGITIAFPQRDIHLDTSEPLEVNLRPKTD